MHSASSKNMNIFIGGSGASPAHGHCGLESLANAEDKDYEALFISASGDMEDVIAVLKMCDNNRALPATFLDPLRRLSNACEDARGPLQQIRQMYIESAKQSLAAGKPASRSTVNLRHFALCARVQSALRLLASRDSPHSPCPFQSPLWPLPAIARARPELTCVLYSQCRTPRSMPPVSTLA